MIQPWETSNSVSSLPAANHGKCRTVSLLTRKLGGKHCEASGNPTLVLASRSVNYPKISLPTQTAYSICVRLFNPAGAYARSPPMEMVCRISKFQTIHHER